MNTEYESGAPEEPRDPQFCTRDNTNSYYYFYSFFYYCCCCYYYYYYYAPGIAIARTHMMAIAKNAPGLDETTILDLTRPQDVTDESSVRP